ncbi:hypothetical protein, conserved [Eimeria tenella]|uniref:Uncharacterized protein n=1 Tax=Eimeria tenella TaxID=5802 RepID=U6LCJ5_EIMTE|nr:hypothetical protein, conserved [Eimeria tenella]CDJ45460.1 hypothetical protein, conserved [Eimeria tenella]|eukprot:XP_013236206.1 hypothetical protein, conserved [Eimeria tenella]
MFAPKPDLAVGLQQQPRPRRQPRLQLQQDEAFCPALQAELLQLLRRARQQLQELQRNCATGSTVTPDFSTYRKSENTLPVESDLHTAVSRAILLQNVLTLNVLKQKLQHHLQLQGEQRQDASAVAAAAEAITAFVQEVQQRYTTVKEKSSSEWPLYLQLKQKRIYWQQQQQQQPLYQTIVDLVLADLEAWAKEAQSDDEPLAVPAEAAVSVQQQKDVSESQRHALVEEQKNREALLQRRTKAPSAAGVNDPRLEEVLLGTANEMKQGALRFRQRLQKDNELLQRTAATQEALQRKQLQGLQTAKKLLRFSFFATLMPLIQLAIAVAITLAMVSFILFTPG